MCLFLKISKIYIFQIKNIQFQLNNTLINLHNIFYYFLINIFFIILNYIF